MPRSAIWLLVATAASALFPSVSGSPQGQKVLSSDDARPRQSRKLQGKFLHITDFHPDEFYKVHTSTEEGVACHRKKGSSGTFGAETTDCDSPFSLVNATLDWIRDNIKDEIDFVVWTGDTARHDSDERLPRSSRHVLDTNLQVTNKFIETFSEDGQLVVPIIPTFGNNDFLPHNIFYPGPNKWLAAYAEIWQHFIPEEQRHAFEFGGWFEVEVIPNKLSVFSLNTMYFFDRNAGVDGCALPSEPGFKHMEWLSVQLQRLRERGMKAILMGHVPPARTDSKQNWDETCWQKYTLWLRQFRDVVSGSLYGHMNLDHFLLQDTNDIDIALFDEDSTREPVEEAFAVKSKGDYLQELRASWSNLPGSVIRSLSSPQDGEEAVEDDDASQDGKKNGKKGGKGRNENGLSKIGGKFAERYQLSIIGPSIVPNYFPTIRIYEYNITGQEDAETWANTHSSSVGVIQAPPRYDVEDLELTDNPAKLERNPRSLGKKKKKKKKGGKGKKGKKKPKDPNLVIPPDPPAESLPGPAYAVQPFSFVGYTQYFANLTYINNDMTGDVDIMKWRDGDFSDRDPKDDDPQPREFKFEVEYDTFTDAVYNLSDLTVRSYLELAYRIGKQPQGVKNLLGYSGDEDLDVPDGSLEGIEDQEDGYNPELDLDFEDDDDDDEESEGTANKNGKGGKGNKPKINKVWLHFLRHAFVKTVPKKDLKKL